MTKLTSTGTAATENFDSLAATGTSTTLPSGWFISEVGSNKTVNGAYTAGNGSSNTGDTYSFGAAGSTDRALGTLFSSTNTPTIGAQFINETGQSLTSLQIAYTGEQWRLGDTTGRQDRLDFQISFDATSLTTGTWKDIDALDFLGPVTTGSLGELNGNAAANQAQVSSTITLETALASGAAFWIRWNDFNASGSDDGLAIDNFSITANPGPIAPSAGTFSIAGGSAAEGTGFVDLKVTRAGGSAGAATLDYLVSAGTANAADFVGGVLPQGQVSFADGQTEATIKIAVVNDAVTEPDETFTVTLANATAGTIGTAAATGKILNDDAQLTKIFEIQGEAHKSSFDGKSVTTTGIVTAVASNGFYLQDKTGDGNARTSDAIFVFTSSAPSVQVGNEATVTGLVDEFLPGNSAANLSTTEIVASAVAVTKDSGGVALVHALPDAVVIGTGGLLPPTDVFDDDNFTVYDPQNDAADFFESLEGMRVTVDAPIVVDRTNSFGETYVVASGGAGSTGLNARGGMTISGNANGFDDYNPERIQLDDSTLSSFKGKYTQGDQLSDVTGIISYDFQSYELLVTGAVTVTHDAPEPTREVTALVGDATHVTMATYNVENLDPSDNKFDILAKDIVNNLRAPDIIALQEIQDKDGAGSGTDLSGTVTAKGLIDAIKALNGVEYRYIEIAPTTAGTTGGEPGGNIRNGFLYNPGRVDYVEGSKALITGAAFTNSRNPLAATFEFNGEEITAISVHSSSRGGSDPLFGAVQPPVNGAEAARIAQSEAIRDYVQDLIGADTEARVAVLGDFNGFYFEQSLELLEAGGLLTNLHRTLPEEERYSYMFGSNAQALDNFLVSSTLYQNAQFDAVHINSEQADTAARGTDHDPLVAAFEIKADVPATPLTVDLSTYVRVGRFDLPTPANASAPTGSQLATEASAITYNWDKDTLFVVGDGTTSIVEISKTGQLIGSMTLASGAFDDIEGLAYVGNGKFVMVEERTRSVISFEYAAGGNLVRSDTQVVKLGTTTGNVGLEGVTYDPETGGYIFVKESDPQGIFQTNVNFAQGTATNGSASTENAINLFDPSLLHLGDMADVFALSNLSTIGTSERGNILVLSQESGKILEVDRQGHILSTLTIIGDPSTSATLQQHEGLAMDKDGVLYVVSENGGGDASHPQLWVYKPSDVPNQAPTAIALTNAASELQENTSTATRLKVADITVTDDQLGNNLFSVTGADAQYFEADATGLYIKAGTVLDYETKSTFSVTVQVDDPTLGSTPDASVGYTLALKDVVNEGTVKSGLYVSEVAPWSSGNSPIKADWFEVTNGGTTTVNIAGWKVDDISKTFNDAVALNGVTSIAAGESVIFIETTTPAATIQTFIDTWFGGTLPAGLQIGTYSGAGIGLSTDGDAVNLYDTTGALQAGVTFGKSPAAAPFTTFNNAAGLDNTAITTFSQVGKNGAFTAAQDSAEIGSPGSTGRLVISEVAPWSSGNSPVGADWFELTNTSAATLDITGWKVDDDSKSFNSAVALSGVTSIHAGESVIFIEVSSPTAAAATVTKFVDTWFGGTLPTGLQIGTYSGSGIGLGAGAAGDQVNIYDAAGKLQANVLFGASPSSAPFATFDNTAGLNGVTLTQLSATGTNGAFKAINDASEIGSPGGATPPVVTNKAPTAIALANTTTTIEENSSTATRIKVADVNVTDDGLGTNQLSVSGTDAKYFEVDSTGLYIKAGTTLDYETQTSYSVTVSVDDTTVGGTPDASVAYKLDVKDVVNEAPQGKVAITEVAPWSNDNSPFKADWFELTNTSTVTVNIAGWKVDDDSKAFGSALALNGITTIAAGESVIFIEGSAAIATQFVDTWFGGVKPAGLQIGTYTGSGIGLGAKGDEVNIYDASGKLQANVAFGAADSTAPYSTFDNTAGLDGTTLTVLSSVGTNGAFKAINDANEIGSPGVRPNAAPTAITLTNAVTAIQENTATTARIKVADVNITDDGKGTNTLGLAGTDAKYFEVDSTGLYVKAGTVLDYETQTSYSVTVTVDDATVGGTPDASTSFKLDVTDVKEAKLAITEVAPWSSGNNNVGADWFEVRNVSDVTADLTGWKMDDNSKLFGSSVALNGVTSLAAGETAIFIETTSAATVQAFIDTWFGGVKPAGLQIGTYSGDGVGLGNGGDQVNLFDGKGTLQASVSFGAATTAAPFKTFDNSAGLDNVTLTALSSVGTNDAFAAVKDANEIGSPGDVSLNKGIVADGYLAGATVFVDVNNNGVLDSGEASAITGADGKFNLFTETTGTIRAFGGTNADTGLANTLVFSAPEGSTVVNPLTTLIQTLVEQSNGTLTVAQAEAKVEAAFGLDPNLDLTKLDLIAASKASDASAFEAQKIAASVAEVLNTVQDNHGNVSDALGALSNLAKDGLPIDVTKIETLSQILRAGLPNATPSVLEQLVEATQDVTQAIDVATTLENISDVQGNTEQVQNNRDPIAANDALTVTVDAKTNNLWSQLLANDTDPDGTSGLRIKAIDLTGTRGTVMFNAETQTLTYAADHDSFDAIPSGGSFTDTFTYTVMDEYGATHSAQVAVTVNAKPNTAPTDLVISNASIAENQNGVTEIGKLSATDSANDHLTYSLVDNAGGPFIVDADTGVVSAVRPLDYETNKSFQIVARATDKAGATVDQTIQIAVTDVNEAPTAKADKIAVNEDATSGNLWDQLIGNDFDPEGLATLKISAVDASGTKGTVQFDANAKTLFYVADDDSFDDLDTGAKASDSFSYTVTDGQFTSTATVQVSVTGVSDGAIRVGSLKADTLTGTSGEDLIGGLLGNDTLYGLDGNDKLWGGLGNDKLFGGNGNDMLSGDFGDDMLDGGAGDDMLFGDTGDDVMTGGAGRDTFGFSLFGGKDTITDFNVAEDRLMLGFGVSVSKTKISDVNGDGKQDLTLTLGLLGLNGSVTLLGVKDYSLVQIDRGDTFISQSPF